MGAPDDASLAERPVDPPRSAPSNRGRVPPVIAGMIVDAVDFATMGPIGLAGGFVLGAIAAGWAARDVGLRGRAVAWVALAGAIYAATPATELVPLGTLIGLVIQLRRR